MVEDINILQALKVKSTMHSKKDMHELLLKPIKGRGEIIPGGDIMDQAGSAIKFSNKLAVELRGR